jgi:hypothetical protein
MSHFVIPVCAGNHARKRMVRFLASSRCKTAD